MDDLSPTASSPPGTRSLEPLPFAALLPGLILIVILDVASLMGVIHQASWPNAAMPWLYAAVPILVLTGWKRGWGVVGIVRQRAILDFGWGLVWGGVWRAGSLLLNFLVLHFGWLSTVSSDLVMVLVLIPWLEEFFFRGYLGKGLCAHLGRWQGIILQALLFTFLPAHWAQGFPHVAGILIFGLLSGWLVERYQSIWPALGAHTFANALPTIVVALAPFTR